jgi:ribosomal protein S6
MLTVIYQVDEKTSTMGSRSLVFGVGEHCGQRTYAYFIAKQIETSYLLKSFSIVS